MNRINRIFQRLRANGDKALMPFITAGDPDLSATAALLPAIQDAGASICEVGFPFSDPIADGPVIQESMARALRQGTEPARIFDMIAQARPQLEMGLVAMVSYSIVHRLGTGPFARQAAAAGVDGLIVPDLPVEETQSVVDATSGSGLTLSLLIAPTTPDARAEQIAQACTGFVYMLARSGLTGERTGLPTDLPARIERLRRVTELPIAVGFGISNADQVRQVVRHADAAIVGSAIMRRVESAHGLGTKAIVADTRQFVTDLCRGLQRPASASNKG